MSNAKGLWLWFATTDLVNMNKSFMQLDLKSESAVL